MKKTLITIVIFIIIITIVSGVAFAQSTSSAELKEIDKFKEKLASKVAELSQKNQKVIAGVVSLVDTKKFKLKTEEDGDFDIRIDQDLTKFYLIAGGQKIDKKITDLKKDAYVIVSGPVVDRVIDANSVYQDEQFLVDFGKVTEIDKTDNLLTVVTAAKEKYTLDIEGTTKQQMMNIKTYDVERSGISKIKEGDSIHFVITKETKVKNRFTAVRILIIPQEYFAAK